MSGNSASSILNTAADLLSQFSGGDSGKLNRALQTVRPWVTRFLASSATKWLPILSREAPCQIATPDGQGGWIACVHPAVDFCDCCGKPVCLHHGRVDANAGIICFPCVAVARIVAQQQRPGGGTKPPPGAQGQAKPPPKAKMPRSKALEALGLKDPVTPADIKSTYKKLIAKWHPDKHSDADKPAAERRFREIQEAWDSLRP